MRSIALPLASVCLLALPLAACDDGKPGATITINSTDSDGNVHAGVDGKTGEVAIDTPVFKGNFKLPKIHLDGANFEMNGVHLYPGSTISTMNIEGRDHSDKDKGGEDDGDGGIRVTFDSPADPATVRDWFKDKLTKAGFTVTASGNGLRGTTDEKKPFALDLEPAGTGHSRGVISING